MQWITVFLAALLATGVGAGSAPAQQAADDSVESLLGGSPLETEGAEFPGAVEAVEAEAFGEEMAPAEMGDDGSLGVIAADEIAVDGGEIELEFDAEAGLVDLTPDGAETDLLPEEPVEPALGPIGYDEAGEQGRIHVVVGGDTLWDISAAYLGTPWVWPSIWESNPGVANPHRIFPGDQIWITPSKMKRVTPEEAAELLARSPMIDEMPIEELPPAAVDEFVDATPVQPSYQSFTYPGMHSVAYVSEEAYEGAGSIVDSPSPHRLLSETRRAYVNLGGGEVSEGDRFSIVRASEEVRDPATNRKIGVLVERLGWLEVTRTSGESSEAVIRQSYAEIERGDRILPQEHLDQEVPMRGPGGAEVDGLVAHFQSSRTVMAQRDLVFLNRGTEDGMEVGAPLEIYRDKGSARDAIQNRSVKLPEDVVAGLVVISADPDTSVAIVTYSSSEIERGDTFRTLR